jgi:purine-nucleoside phosphorylase
MAGEREIRRAAGHLEKRLPARPDGGVVLGSGMGACDLGKPSFVLPYARIPGFPRTGVAGHAGELSLVGRTLVLRGRVHLYEGRPVEETVRAVRIAARLGVRTLVLTNAAGALNPRLRPGDLMLISDHLNLTGANPLAGGPGFLDLSEVYDRGLRARVRGVPEGVYAAVPGPTYETPAEVRMLRTLGADAVGMSTVPEAIAARAEGMKVLGISLITNLAAGLSKRPLSHAEVLETGRRGAARLGSLLRDFLKG